MFGLYVSLILLGLAAIDPVGIGIVCLLLVQEQPYLRTFIFLGGSFSSLVVMGVLFAKGLGQPVLHIARHSPWIAPATEAIGGIILLSIAIVLYAQIRRSAASMQPSPRMGAWLKLSPWHIFFLGIGLVAVQSVLDIVFVIAMIRIGQFSFSNVFVIAAVVIYSISALALQLLVVAAFKFTPDRQKAKTIRLIHSLLDRHSRPALLTVSFGLGLILLVLACVGR